MGGWFFCLSETYLQSSNSSIVLTAVDSLPLPFGYITCNRLWGHCSSKRLCLIFHNHLLLRAAGCTTVNNTSCSGQQLFEFMLSHEKMYGMRAIRMMPYSDDADMEQVRWARNKSVDLAWGKLWFHDVDWSQLWQSWVQVLSHDKINNCREGTPTHGSNLAFMEQYAPWDGLSYTAKNCAKSGKGYSCSQRRLLAHIETKYPLGTWHLL